MAQLSFSWGEWVPLYQGIERAINLNPNLPFPAVPIPAQWPLPNINLIRVRLDDPHITTYSTPKWGLSPDGVPLSQFLPTTFNAPNQIAVQGIVGTNANFFDNDEPHDKRNTIYGLAVSNGAMLPWLPRPDGSPYYPLLITKSNQATIGAANEAARPDTWTAVSGNVLLLRNGLLAVPPPANKATVTPRIAARTGMGVSHDPDYLYLITVDGLETDDLTQPYYGASDFDVAVMLLLAGATDAINLDGGGSTTMGRIDSKGFVLMNVPYDNDAPPSSERSVGNCFAVIAHV